MIHRCSTVALALLLFAACSTGRGRPGRGGDGGGGGGSDGGGGVELDGGTTGLPDAGPGCGETEVCGDGLDDDCDGEIDEECTCEDGATQRCYDGPLALAGVGICAWGTQTCVGEGVEFATWSVCKGSLPPGEETCDGVADEDCDGSVDEGCGCALGLDRPCYTGPAGTAGVGICHEGAQTCIAGPDGMGAMWGDCVGEQLPEPDLCDGVDYACTGAGGAGCACILGRTQPCYGGPPATRGVGVCRDGTQTCAAGASGPAWSATCTGQRIPAAEVCGNRLDDDCDGSVDEGCGGTVMCPGDTTTPAGQAVTLTATGVGIASWSWTIVSAPAGGAGVAVWTPAPPTTRSVTFQPFIVGDYLLEVRGTDASGAVVTCRFTVTALPHGLRVELTWDGAGDVDLHLHDATATPWFASPQDCYYSDTAPAWGAVLDFDNTTASGPENISMASPAIASDYTIAVHNYARAAGRVATVRVFCGSTTSTVPTATYTSRALAGAAAGNCTANDFWTVARVRFTSASACTITPIGTYRASSSACTSF